MSTISDVPSGVQEILLKTPGQRTQKEVERLGRFSKSTLGKELGGISGVEELMMGPLQRERAELQLEREKLALEQAGFVPTKVETDPDTGRTVQVYEKDGEERRKFVGTVRAPQPDITDPSAGFVQPEAQGEAVAKEGFSIVK